MSDAPKLYEQLITRRRDLFEHRIVTTIFTASGLSAELPRLKKDVFRETGSSRFSLTWFHKHFDTFPIALDVLQPQPDLAMGWTTLFTPFRRHPFYLAYRAHPNGEAALCKRPYFGLVCYADGFGAVVLHNDLPCDRSRAESETRIQRVFGKRKVRLVIEPLQTLVASINSTWFTRR